MIPWRLYPFVRPCIFFIAGIFMHEWLTLSSCLFIVFFIVFLFFSFFFEFFQRHSVAYSFFSGYLILGASLLLGIFTATLHNSHHKYSIIPAEMHGLIDFHLIGVITEIPDQKRNNKTRLNTEWICNADTCISWPQTVIVYYPDNETSLNKSVPAQGDRLILTGKVSEISANTNPGAFDYKKYMQRQGINYQLWVDTFFLIEKQRLGIWMQNIMNLRNHCLNVFDKYLQGEERAIAKAMILGFRQEVDEDLYHSFSASGSMHILAVSGMHLAVIADILLKLVKKISKGKPELLKLLSLLTLFMLWIFSFITGAESAIVRSAIMFSLILYGNTLGHHYSVYNIMAFCAIIMLLFQPALIFNPGFLFSFLSLLSLLFFHPFIEAWWIPPDKFSAWVWQFVSASLAAQVLIAPLTIFIFHQFPLYFILSGFIPVWISVLSLKTGLLVLCTEFILPEINRWITIPFQFLTEYFIKSVRWVESLPYSCLDDVYMGAPEFIFYNLSLLGLMIYCRIKSFALAIFTLFFLILALAVYGVRIIAQKEQRSITVYAGKKDSLTDLIIGHSCFAYGDSTRLIAQAPFMYAANRMKKGVKNINYIRVDHKSFRLGNIKITPDSIVSPDMKIFIYNGKIPDRITRHFNIMVVTKSLWPPNSLPYTIKPYLILDSSVKGKCLDSWKKFAEQNKYDYYAVAQQGALTFNW